MSVLSEIKEEINYYNPPQKVADALLHLGRRGLRFSGHGVFLSTNAEGTEDIGVMKEFGLLGDTYVYVIIEWKGRSFSTDVHIEKPNKSERFCFDGFAKARDFIDKHKLHTKRGIDKYLDNLGNQPEG